VVCSESGCNVTLCVSPDPTACVTWDAHAGTPWLCVRHNSKKNNPIKVGKISQNQPASVLTHANLQYTLNTRVKSFLLGGRVLRPLLYIHLYPCEKKMDMDTLTSANIQGRLHDYYKHQPVELVRYSFEEPTD
jgi:hypothetical protein